jgi:hypothetical protein
MDGTRLDRWARMFASSRSRRGVVSLLAAGSLLGLVESEATAKKKGKGNGKGNGNGKKGCKRNQKKCGKKCISKDDCCSNDDCDQCALEVCRDGVCGCDPEHIRHNGVCGSFDNCLAAGELTDNHGKCCSNESVIDIDSGQERCLPGDFRCTTPIDCFGAPCRGFMCPGQYHVFAPNC